MAVEYAKVMKAQDRSFTVIGRGKASALTFEENTGVPVIVGGLEEAIAAGKAAKVNSAIVSVGVEALYPTSMALLSHGVKRLLIEKPGLLHPHQIDSLQNAARSVEAEVYIAYNRRFLSSVRRAQEIIESDGGVTSFTFDFTEWSHEIASLPKAPGVKERWLLGNSSHVLDLAFYLGGRPRYMSTTRTGKIEWHPAGSVFVGSGITIDDVPFSYHANWNAPGRWSLEFCTKNHKLIFRPLEKLNIMRKGSVLIEEDSANNEDIRLDKDFKPGLYREVEAFFNGDKRTLCGVDEFKNLLKAYCEISGY